MHGGHRVQPAGRSVAQWVQVPVFGAVAMLLTLAGHLMGDGDPPAWPALVLVAVGSAALRSVIGRAVRSTVAMFGALLAAQVLGHLTFLVLSPVTSGAIVGHHGSILLPTLDASGGPVLGGDTWMWLAHTVAAGLVAVWLFRGESLSEALARRLVAMVRRLPRFAPVEVGHGRPSQPEAPMVRGRHTVLFDAPRRGPPVRPRTHALALIAPRRHGSPSSDCTRTMPSTPAQRRRKDPLSRPHLKPSDCSVLNSHGMPPRCDKTGGIPLSRTSGSTAWGPACRCFGCPDSAMGGRASASSLSCRSRSGWGNLMSSSARARAAMPRRTVATGLAWAVPAVLLVAGTPAYAASGDIVKVLDSSVACKITGTTKRYQFTLVFQNTGTTTTTLCVTAGQMITNGANCDDPNVDPTVLPKCVDVTAGTTVSLKFLSVPAECLSNGYMTLTYTYTLVGGTTVVVNTQVPFNSVTPC